MRGFAGDLFRLYVDAVLAAQAATITVALRTLRLQGEFLKTGGFNAEAWDAMASEKASAFTKGAVRGAAALGEASLKGPANIAAKTPRIARAALKPPMQRARANARRLSKSTKRKRR